MDCGQDRDCGCAPQDPCPALALETTLSRGAPPYSLVEVQHTCCDGDDWAENRQNNYDVKVSLGSNPDPEPDALRFAMPMPTHPPPPLKIGLWHYLSPGSGIFFNVGKTFATEWHETLNTDVVLKLGCNWSMVRGHRRQLEQEPRLLNTWADMGLECLRALGYDSVQFTHYMEGTLTKLEIVSIRDTHAQVDGCFDPAFGHMYRRGWNADEECRCNPPGQGHRNLRRNHGQWGHGLNCDG